VQASAKPFYVQDQQSSSAQGAIADGSQGEGAAISGGRRVVERYTVASEEGEALEDISNPSPGAKTLKINIDLLLVRLRWCLWPIGVPIRGVWRI